MKAISGRTPLVFGLLGLVLAGALWTGLTAWQGSVMHLQSSPDADEVLVSFGSSPGDKTVTCTSRDHCQWPTQDLARTPVAERLPNDGKLVAVPGADVLPKQN